MVKKPKMLLGLLFCWKLSAIAPTVKVEIVSTSDKCYENKEWIWGYREYDPMGGDDPYSASKRCAELVTSQPTENPFSILLNMAENVILFWQVLVPGM